jgi:type II secretory pathway pseudopilin PulG
VLLSVATVVVCATVIAAVVSLGPPSQSRKLRLDSLRTEQLQELEGLIESYARLHKQLPDTLATLAHEPGYQPTLTDPVSGESYAYERLGADWYRVCGSFDLPSQKHSGRFEQTWAHHAGKQCFDRRVTGAVEDPAWVPLPNADSKDRASH